MTTTAAPLVGGSHTTPTIHFAHWSTYRGARHLMPDCGNSAGRRLQASLWLVEDGRPVTCKKCLAWGPMAEEGSK